MRHVVALVCLVQIVAQALSLAPANLVDDLEAAAAAAKEDDDLLSLHEWNPDEHGIPGRYTKSQKDQVEHLKDSAQKLKDAALEFRRVSADLQAMVRGDFDERGIPEKDHSENLPTGAADIKVDLKDLADPDRDKITDIPTETELGPGGSLEDMLAKEAEQKEEEDAAVEKPVLDGVDTDTANAINTAMKEHAEEEREKEASAPAPATQMLQRRRVRLENRLRQHLGRAVLRQNNDDGGFAAWR